MRISIPALRKSILSGASGASVSLVALALASSLGATGCKKKAEVDPPLKVAAAADLAFAFKDVGDAFEKKTGRKVSFSFGSTGLLAKQIAEGAPYDVFAAANVSFIDDTVKAGACAADTASLYATGRVVAWVKAGPAPASVADLADARYTKVAIANPEHAPYGRAAKQALERAGVWEKVQPKLVFGENVQQTLQYAQSGNAEAAIVALSLATVSGGAYLTIDSALHDRLDQELVVCRGTPASAGAMQPIARSFTAFVNSEDGRAIMRRYGFLLPGESLVKAGAP